MRLFLLMEHRKAMLIIMDGWGHGAKDASDAIHQAHTPFVDSLYSSVPHTELATCGEAVGLPVGQMGNSEVGHFTIGAGQIVFQELARINKSIRDGAFEQNEMLRNAFQKSKKNGTKVHLLGLVSDGGVHSHIDHLFALLRMAQSLGHEQTFVHAFTDGRDCDPKSGLAFIQALELECAKTQTQIASVSGRYFAMDRDKRWDRVAKVYHALVNAQGLTASSASEVIQKSYSEGVTDEFILPHVLLNQQQQPFGQIEHSDTVIFFNFRTDRGRELTQMLHQQAFPDQKTEPLELDYYTFTRYDETFRNVSVIFEKEGLKFTLGQKISAEGKTQLRMAETEKYPHVTFFFNGQVEEPYQGEKRVMVASPKVATYDLQPEMSALELTEACLEQLHEHPFDFVVLNFANPDMVGHTGVFDAIKKAVETVDSCVKKVVDAALKLDYSIFLTADHGNADCAVNADGTPNTAHTLNLVPLFLINCQRVQPMRGGGLSDLAPMILREMGMEE
jgi:2,3-bisphosphoglycerate-independent phosphoglycerate mutase